MTDLNNLNDDSFIDPSNLKGDRGGPVDPAELIETIKNSEGVRWPGAIFLMLVTLAIGFGLALLLFFRPSAEETDEIGEIIITPKINTPQITPTEIEAPTFQPIVIVEEENAPQQIEARLEDPPLGSICDTHNIWAIGRFEDSISKAGTEFQGGTRFFEVYQYDLENNEDDVFLSPEFPGFMYNGRFDSNMWVAEEIQIIFDADETYEASNLHFARYGSESTEIYLDGALIETIIGPGESIAKTYNIALGELSQGEHTVALRYVGGGSNNGYIIDALRLQGKLKAPSGSLLWQVGEYHGATLPWWPEREFAQGSSFQKVFEYDVSQANSEMPINAPKFLNNSSSSKYWSAERINFNFKLDSTVSSAVIRYSRFGTETNNIYLDDELIGTTFAKNEGQHSEYSLPIENISAGNHTLSIEYFGDGDGSGNYYDSVGICISEPDLQHTP